MLASKAFFGDDERFSRVAITSSEIRCRLWFVNLLLWTCGIVGIFKLISVKDIRLASSASLAQWQSYGLANPHQILLEVIFS